MTMVYSHKQQTLADAIRVTGVGLHTGEMINSWIRPAEANSGFVFVRVDLDNTEINGTVAGVTNAAFATTLSHGPATVTTIEHLLSALVGLGVDNARIEVDGPEMPVLDGSAAMWVQHIRSVGLSFQSAQREYYQVTEPITVGDRDRGIEITPWPWLQVDFELDYDHPHIGQQTYSYIHSPEEYVRQIAAARTFTVQNDLERMQNMGLVRGGNLSNAVLVADSGVVNPEGLRFPDEFVRHKILDVLGDFALLGRPLLGKISAMRSGHSTNVETVKSLLAARTLENYSLDQIVTQVEIDRAIGAAK